MFDVYGVDAPVRSGLVLGEPNRWSSSHSASRNRFKHLYFALCTSPTDTPAAAESKEELSAILPCVEALNQREEQHERSKAESANSPSSAMARGAATLWTNTSQCRCRITGSSWTRSCATTRRAILRTANAIDSAIAPLRFRSDRSGRTLHF